MRDKIQTVSGPLSPEDLAACYEDELTARKQAEAHVKHLKEQVESLNRLRTAEQVVGDLFRHLNGDRYGISRVIQQHLQGEHRTLVQAFVRDFIFPACDELRRHGEEGWVDARNEGAVQWATNAINANEGTYLPLI